MNNKQLRYLNYALYVTYALCILIANLTNLSVYKIDNGESLIEYLIILIAGISLGIFQMYIVYRSLYRMDKWIYYVFLTVSVIGIVIFIMNIVYKSLNIEDYISLIFVTVPTFLCSLLILKNFNKIRRKRTKK
jgi:hypothetical protein